MFVVHITKKIETITTIQDCLISRMNVNYKENGGKKSFSCKSRASISCIPMWRTWSSANNKMNRDYYEYPSLSHFTDELWLLGKWWKEKLFLQIQSIKIIYSYVENMIVVPRIKIMEIITDIQVCLISWMNFDYNENWRKKSFSCKSKVSISCI